MPFFANCWIVALAIRLVKGGKLYMIKSHAFVLLDDGRVLHFTPKFESALLRRIENWTTVAIPVPGHGDIAPLFLGKVGQMKERKVRLLFKMASPRLVF